MAKEFECPKDSCTFTDWADDEATVIETAQDHLEDHGISMSTDEIRDHIRVIPSPRRIKSSASGVMDERRRRAGKRAAEVVEDGMDVGLGTGSTTAWAIAELGQRVADGLDIRGVATSIQSHELAKEAGIPLVNLDELTALDIAIDGADQYSVQHPHVVKGGGASHAREKVIDTAAEQFIIVTDETKAPDPLDHSVPLSVLSESRTLAAEWVRNQGGEPKLRYAEAKDSPLFTANGNLVLDCDFGSLEHPEDCAVQLASIPGAQEHGLFVNMVDELYIGTDDGVEQQQF